MVEVTHTELVARVQRLEARFDTVVTVLNELATAVNQLASLEQLRRINLIRQTEIDDINTNITAMQTEITALNTEVFK